MTIRKKGRHIFEGLLGKVQYPLNANTEAISGATKTLDAQDVGKLLLVSVTSVITLPATSVGLYFWIMCDGQDGTVQISIDPNANDKIMGPDSAGVDNKDWINTLATARKGDCVKLIADGVDGYYVAEQVGTWAAEA